MQMSVILCSHGLLDWFNKTILFYSILNYSILYPNEPEVKDTTDTQKFGSQLDRHLEIVNGGRQTTTNMMT
jgi:hypothetical protein